ncbi:PGF-CTERM-anchored ABC transporter substrate-binding protein [Natrinema marinum]|uniref:PGF-CTERM-anchored ABC transporter substrate-binding protein n=1 Tax=Natrinema marinum TaxID=2961598 RepID=UPI0020C869C2|nr:PGF-CTERM-anchored ABC transporter substrate-binding protein [Natrinema marinum]
MRRHVPVLLAVLLIVSAFAPAAAGQSNAESESTVECEFPLEMTDATGETITLEERPDSIVALQASDAQTVFEIGAEGNLTGMAYSSATGNLERGDRANVGNGFEINHEQVISLEPDLVLAASITSDEDIEQLRSAGLTVYKFERAESLEDVKENVRTTGKLTGECDGAEETVDWMNEQLAIVERTLENVDRPTAYYAMGDGYTAGSGTFIDEVLTTAGVENMAAEVGIESYGQVNPETVVNENPDWIIYPDDRESPPIHESVQATAAYQNDNTIAVNANHISQPAPQVVSAVVSIVETVHPEAYAEAEAELEVSAGNGTESDNESTDDESSGESAIPGFGVPAAAVALLATAGFVTRRR